MFLLGPIFEAQQGIKDSPFNVHPVRGRYMWRDVERLCEKHGLAWRRPSTIPRSGLLAARIACVAAGEAWMPAFARAVFRANFAHDEGIAEPAVLEAVLGGLGVPGRWWLEQAATANARQLLREQTARAAQAGMFGAPHFFAGEELFFGQDRLDDALAWCKR
jgi:2-hydroxychromene-2-carboxylate isomerase